MPCMEITIPKIKLEKKQKLATYLSADFENATKISAEIFAIKFIEYDDGEAFIGGKMVLVSSEKVRPYIHCLLYSPRLSKVTKSNLASSFSTSFAKVFKQKDYCPILHICEHPYDNVAINGKLLSETYEHCKNAKFYYELNQI